jgi:hypothetical protein
MSEGGMTALHHHDCHFLSFSNPPHWNCAVPDQVETRITSIIAKALVLLATFDVLNITSLGMFVDHFANYCEPLRYGSQALALVHDRPRSVIIMSNAK